VLGNWTTGSSAQQQAANINTRQQARNRILDNLRIGVKGNPQSRTRWQIARLAARNGRQIGEKVHVDGRAEESPRAVAENEVQSAAVRTSPATAARKVGPAAALGAASVIIAHKN